MQEHDDELYHYGVLGMKWGVRKARKDARSAYRAASKAVGGKSHNELNKRYLEKQDEYKRKKSEYDQEVAKRKVERAAKRIKPDDPVSQLERYKKSQRIKTAVGASLAVLGTVGVGALAYTGLIKAGEGVVKFIHDLPGPDPYW